jgi:hypothetical protein
MARFLDEGILDPLAVPPIFDKPRAFENRQVLGHRGRSKTEDGLHLTDTKPAAFKQLEDAGSGRIADRFHRQFKVSHGIVPSDHFVTWRNVLA